MLTIATELFSHLAEEADTLTAAHWDEVEAPLHGSQHYALNHNRYASLEQLGMLHISAARGLAGDDHTDAAATTDATAPLAGYAAFTLVDCPHKPQTLLAALDGLYLAPWARGGLFALRLLRHAESALAARGVGLVQYSSPTSRPCHALYRRLGAQPTETIWHKTLPPQPGSSAASGAASGPASGTASGTASGADSVKEDKQWP